MRSRITQTERRQFPKLLVSKTTDLVVLFNKDKEGIVLNPDNEWPLTGFKESDWEMESFENFRGTIELSND